MNRILSTSMERWRFRSVRSFLTNAGVTGLGSVVLQAATMMLVIYAGRALGVEEFGKFAIGYSFSAIMLALAESGISIILAREVSKTPGKTAELFSSALAYRSAVTLVIVFAAGLAVYAIGYSGEVVFAVFGLSLFSILLSYSNLFRSILQANEMFNWLALIKVGNGVSLLVLGVLFLSVNTTLQSLVLAWIGSGLIVLAVCWIVVRMRIGKLSFVFHMTTTKYLAVESIYVGAAAILWSVAVRTIPLLLSWFRTPSDVAFFEAGFQLFAIIGVSYSTIINVVVFPRMAKLFIVSADRARVLYSRLIIGTIGIGLVIVLFILIFSHQIIGLTFGDEFSRAGATLQILSIAVIFSNVMDVSTNVLNATGYQRVNAAYAAIMLPITFVISLVLIPWYGSIGAVSAYTLSTVLGSGLVLLFSFHGPFGRRRENEIGG